MPFVADDEPSEILQPGEQALDLPSPYVSAQRTTILSHPATPIPRVWRDHLNTEVIVKSGIQLVAIVGLVPDNARRELFDETCVYGVFGERNFVRRSACNTSGDRKTMRGRIRS